MSLRKAVNAMCRHCAYDPADIGGASHQIAACTSADCPLHAVRPITCARLPDYMLEVWNIVPRQLDERARALVEERPACSQDVHIARSEMPPCISTREG